MKQEIDYTVALEAVNDLNELSLQWRYLELKSNNEFFLSWTWISTWLHVFSPPVKLVKVTVDGEIVAMALITYSIQKRHGWLSSNVLRLHQTGSADEDQIWIEYNGILVNELHEKGALPAVFSSISSNVNRWDELILGAARQSTIDSLDIKDLHKHLLWEAPCYGVNLKYLRESGIEYLSHLSRNTRYQINKAYRLAKQEGELVVATANSTQQALEWFDDMAPLHKQRWGASSGFNNSSFIDFHRELIRQSYSQSNVELVRVELAGRLVAVLYNFLYEKKVYFYLSGIDYRHFKSIKPGLLCHTECISRYMKLGWDYYDFMAGDSQYKRSLGEPADKLQMVSLQRPKVKLKVEQMLRRIKGLVN